MAENDLTKVARIAAGAAQGVITKDANGNQKIIKPTGDANYLDFTNISFGGSTGATTGGGNSDNTPAGTDTSGGVNIIPGSLTDGSLTERYLQWQGPSQTGSPTKINFPNEVGTNLNLVGDGLQFYGHLEKVPVTAGVQGTATSIPLKFDPTNVSSAGYFVTTSPCPISINRSTFTVGKKITITLNGFGEGLANIKDHLAPTVSFTFNADKSMTVEVTQGHGFDAGTADSTGSVKTNGAIYTYVLDSINSYSVQAPVSQLPTGMPLFSGLIYGPAKLAGVDSFFDNVGDELEITIDDYIYLNERGNVNDYALLASFLNCPTTFKVLKKDLIIGNEIPVSIQVPTNLGTFSSYMQQNGKWIQNTDSLTLQGLTESYVRVKEDSLEVVINFNLHDMDGNYTTVEKIKSITTV